MKEEVIELSIEETQALRAKLGLAPLRLKGDELPKENTNYSNIENDDNNHTTGGNDKEIALSIDETNALRLKLGLSPLQLDDFNNNNNNNNNRGTSTSTSTSTKKEEIHRPPPTDKHILQQAADRIQDAKDRREALDKLNKWKEEEKREKEEESAMDFAAKMRKGTSNGDGKKKKKKKSVASAPMSIPNDQEEEEHANENNSYYTASDLQGLKVGHDVSSFQTGTTTILTLSDKHILAIDPDSQKVTGLREAAEQNELINVNMMDDTNALENLKRKRLIELGAGRAGGYAGFDDHEFEEFGGVVGYEGNLLGGGINGGNGKGDRSGASKGFAIGHDGKAIISQPTNQGSDLFTGFKGGAISLESRHGNKTIASDFITQEEMDEGKEEKIEKERKRQMKLLEKMRKKDKQSLKKSKKASKRSSYDEDESEGETGDNHGSTENADNDNRSGSLLDSLEATAVKEEMRKKRRREGNAITEVEVALSKDESNTAKQEELSDEQLIKEKRTKFDRIMEKGKIRTDRAFKSTASLKSFENASPGAVFAGDEDDDAFLNAALAKARRIQRLKELNDSKPNGQGKTEAKGEAAVVQAIEKMKKEEATASEGTVKSNGGITFENDEIQEFTRALRAREDQIKRAPEKSRGVKSVSSGDALSSRQKKEVVNASSKVGEEVVEDIDMEELANEIKHEDNNDTANDDTEQGGFGSTAGSAPIGRGMSNFLALLKQTGEIKHSGREEMRGRAKDKRTYEDYDHLNLKEVVKIDTRYAQDKDIELANREIKLEYRDDHGRLLTRKEAYRNMCYQFHGHGSSKKNQERRLRQIEREREEVKLASRLDGGAGTLGALKATQKATGKAFIIHKTS
ncbi:hypothetical protein ACHAWX_003035 [Stephanocyclus meneghinianus]